MPGARIPPGYSARLPDGTLLTREQQLDRMVTESRAVRRVEDVRAAMKDAFR